jgi:hypothetical protein
MDPTDEERGALDGHQPLARGCSEKTQEEERACRFGEHYRGDPGFAFLVSKSGEEVETIEGWLATVIVRGEPIVVAEQRWPKVLGCQSLCSEVDLCLAAPDRGDWLDWNPLIGVVGVRVRIGKFSRLNMTWFVHLRSTQALQDLGRGASRECSRIEAYIRPTDR